MRKLFLLFSVLLMLTLVLAACGGDEPPPPPSPTNTSVPVPATEEPTTTPEVEEEAQPEPTTTEAPAPETEEEPAPEPEAEAPAEEPASESPVDEPDAAAAGGVRTFVIVPEQSVATYIVAEEFFGGALDRLGIEPGLVDTIGSTQQVNGEMQLDFGNSADPLVSNQFEVNINSLTSDQSRRDNRIREANLESNRFPLALFTITSLENAPASFADGDEVAFQAAGDITIREITQPTTFDVTAQLNGDTITGVAATRLKMSDFGFAPPNFANMFSVEDEFTAQVEFTFQEQ